MKDKPEPGDAITVMTGSGFVSCKFVAEIEDNYWSTDVDGLMVREDDHMGMQLGGGAKRPGSWAYDGD